MSEYTEHIYQEYYGKTYEPIHQREEIVRCRDCNYCEVQTVSYSNVLLYVCIAEWCEGSEYDNPLVEPNWFCACGRRREGC